MSYPRIIFSFFLLLFYHLSADTPKAIVSIAPYQKLVEEIAGNTIEVSVLIPENANPHFFEPTPKSFHTALSADIYFMSGQPVEKILQEAITSQKTKIKLIDITASCLQHHGVCSHHHEPFDTHYWLSPKQLINQAALVKEALIQIYPEHKAFYQNNAEQLIKKLMHLDKTITQLLEKNTDSAKTIFVSHPAYTHFCHDYHLHQIPIEAEGKEPSLKKMHRLIKKVEETKATYIIIDPRHPHQGADLIAETLDLKPIIIDPLEKDFFSSIEKIAALSSR